MIYDLPTEFYDRISIEYDGMTGREKRIDAARRALAHFVEEYDIHSAVDMGCGSGVHAAALADLGVNVVGVDISPRMIAVATESAGSRTRTRFQTGDFFSSFSLHMFDAVFCLGNSLPHIESEAALRAVLTHWHGLLKPKGRLIVQLLNFDRFMRTGERIVAVTRSGSVLTVRFYDFTDPRWTFNILFVRGNGSHPSHELLSTQHTPFLHSTIHDAALDAGFTDIFFSSTLFGDAWDENARDTIILATAGPAP
ncbi:MAG: methyltransferase domain-containing protein [Bacteroidota bacterium]|nr:methyltransferase domain-containing protein [Bacteroidota bacterium]